MKKTSRQYIEEIQGIILFLSYKRKYRVTMAELMNLNKATYNDLLKEIKEIDPNTLQNEHILNETNMSAEVLLKIINDILPDHLKKINREAVFEREKNTPEFEESFSKYQNKAMYMVMQTLKEDLLVSCKKLNYNIVNFPLLASTYTNNFNACAIKLSNDEPKIILFEEEVFRLSHIISTFIASLIPFDGTNPIFDPNSILENFDKNQKIGNQFTFLIHEIIDKGTCGHVPILIKNAVQKKLVGGLTNSMELFIMAHEFGHIYKGHLENSEEKKFHFDNDAVSISPSWEYEYEADEVGFILSKKTLMEKYGVPNFIILAGLATLFAFMDIISDMKKSYAPSLYTPTQISTHPPNGKRWIALIKKESETDCVVAEIIIHCLSCIYKRKKSDILSMLEK